MTGFYLAPDGTYRSRLLDSFGWLEHGFGTRRSEGWLDSQPLASLKQTHSATTHLATGEGCLGEGDALITRSKGVWVSVRTADCVPVILADPLTFSAAVVHSGWRGTAASIATVAAQRLVTEFGANPASLVAAIGPAIGVCCYQVGPEVVSRLKPWLAPIADDLQERKVDLRKAIARQLASFGISRIEQGDWCTRCDPALHSFRRDGAAAGRMVSAARIKA